MRRPVNAAVATNDPHGVLDVGEVGREGIVVDHPVSDDGAPGVLIVFTHTHLEHQAAIARSEPGHLETQVGERDGVAGGLDEQLGMSIADRLHQRFGVRPPRHGVGEGGDVGERGWADRCRSLVE